MGLFSGKSEEQKKFEEEQRQKQEELEERVNDALEQILVFPGSKSEFEDFIEYKTLWVNLGRNVKGLIFDKYGGPFNNDSFYFYKFDLKKKIVDSGVVALVNANFSHNTSSSGPSTWYYFGMPVKRKEEKSN